MRDPKRIPIVLGEIQKTWEKSSTVQILNQNIRDDEFIREFNKFYDGLLNEVIN